MPFIPTTNENREEMLKTIGVSGFVELLEAIPAEARFKGDLDFPSPLSEYEVTKLLKKIAEENEHIGAYTCFLGGVYDHFIAAAVEHIVSRPEFYTAYTPYQLEVNHSTLQAIYEYQTLIANLTGMDVVNALMYDGSSALAEAALLAHVHTKRDEILLSNLS